MAHKKSSKKTTTTTTSTAAAYPLDFVVCIDATGSMGPWLEQVKTSASKLVQDIAEIRGCASLRFAVVMYRDYPDKQPATLVQTFTSDVQAVQSAVAALQPSGGADAPEAVSDALRMLNELAWRPDAVKSAVLIADAPPHGVGCPGDSYPDGVPSGECWKEQTETAREKGIVIHTVRCNNFQYGESFEYISQRTFGSSVSLSDATVLSQVICSSAATSVDQLRVYEAIKNLINGNREIVEKATKNGKKEDMGVKTLLKLAKSAGLVHNAKLQSAAATTTSDITEADVTGCLVHQRKSSGSLPKEWMDQFFPTLGIIKPPVEVAMYEQDKNGNDGEVVPLVSIQVAAQIVDAAAKVKISQVYENRKDSAIEAVYVFPIDHLSAVHSFSAIIGGRKLKAKCKKTKEAIAEYEAAVEQGQTAALLEQDTDDVFRMSLGNIPPHSQITVIVKYITELQEQVGTSDVSRFVFPLTIVSKYAQHDTQVVEFLGTEDAPRLHQTPFALTFSANASTSGSFVNISSPTHPVKIQYQNGKKSAAITLDSNFNLDSDLVLLLQNNSKQLLSCFIETDGNVMAIIKTPKNLALHAVDSCVTLLLDLSYSMLQNFDKLDAIATAVTRALMNVSNDKLHFNVVCFGGTVVSLFVRPQRINATSIATQVSSFLRTQLTAQSLGGTELYRAITHQIHALSPHSIKNHNFLLVSDGGMTRLDELVKLLQYSGTDHSSIPSKIGCINLHVWGVGTAINKAFLYQLSVAGRGHCVFTHSDEKVDWKVAAMQFAHRLVSQPQPVQVTYVRGAAERISHSLESARHVTLAPNSSFSVVSVGLPADATAIHIDIGPHHHFEFKVDASTAVSGKTIQLLGAKRQLRYMEMCLKCIDSSSEATKTALEDNIANLALRHNLASSQTSFVLVDDQTPATAQPAQETVEVGLAEVRTSDSATKKRKAAPVALPSCPDRSVRSRPGGGGGADVSGRRKRVTEMMSDVEEFHLVKPDSNLVVQTPFGFDARVNRRNARADPYLWGLFKGCLNSKNADCWLDSTMALLATLDPFRSMLLSLSLPSLRTTQPVIVGLAAYLQAWIGGQHDAVRFRSNLRSARQLLWNGLKTAPFDIIPGLAFCPIKVISMMIQFGILPAHLMHVLVLSGDPESTLERAAAATSLPPHSQPYLLVLNTLYGSRPRSKDGRTPVFPGYELVSFLHYHSLGTNEEGRNIGHYICLAKGNVDGEDGMWIYDDILSIDGHQGGFIPMGGAESQQRSCYNKNFDFWVQNVPVLLYRKRAQQ